MSSAASAPPASVRGQPALERKVGEPHGMQVRIPVADGMFASYGPYDGCLDGSIAHLERTIGWCKKYVQRNGGGWGRCGYHRTVMWQVWLAGPPGPSHCARRRQWFRQRWRRVEPRVAWPCAPRRYTPTRPPNHRAHGADTTHPAHPRTPHTPPHTPPTPHSDTARARCSSLLPCRRTHAACRGSGGTAHKRHRCRILRGYSEVLSGTLGTTGHSVVPNGT